MLDEVGLHQVVQDVVFAYPLHRAAAGGAERGALHPAGVTGSAEHMHARLQTEAQRKESKHTVCTHKIKPLKVPLFFINILQVSDIYRACL